MAEVVVSIERQIKAVEREIALRERVYKKRVADGKMPLQQSLDEILAMRAVLETLKGVQAAAAEYRQPTLEI